MTDRQIFQSQRYPDLKILSSLDEELAKLLRQRRYKQIIEKCQNMSMSKHKYLILCYAYLGLKEWKHLIECCEKGLQFDMNEPDFYSLKAKSLGKLGKHHQKILLLQKAISLDGGVASYYRNLGSAYYNIKNYELACKEYDKAIQLQPENIFNYHNKGSALLKNQQFQQAKKFFLLALEKNPNVALSYSWLADCQKMLGNLDEAQKLYNKAYQLSQNKVYLQEKQKLEKEKNLKRHEGRWYYSIAWLGSKIM